MTDITSTQPAPQDLEGGVHAVLFGILFFASPIMYLLIVESGRGFFEGYLLYFRLVEIAGVTIGIIGAGIVFIIRKWPALFKAPPLPETAGIPAAACALVLAIVIGSLFGFSWGAVLVWPLAFVLMGVTWFAHWARHLWLRYRTPRGT